MIAKRLLILVLVAMVAVYYFKSTNSSNVVVTAETVSETDDFQPTEADVQRFEKVVNKVFEHQPVEKAELEWAKSLVKQSIDFAKSGKAEKKMLAQCEQMVDKAIQAGELRPEDKSQVMELAKVQSQMRVQQALTEGKELLKALESAKTE